MPPLVLGRAPSQLTVAVSPGSPLFATLRSQDAAGEATDWTAGTTLRLVLSRGSDPGFSQSWDWSVDGELATLTVAAAEVDALPIGPLHAQLWLNYGQGEFLWCAGSVVRHA